MYSKCVNQQMMENILKFKSFKKQNKNNYYWIPILYIFSMCISKLFKKYISVPFDKCIFFIIHINSIKLHQNYLFIFLIKTSW